MTKQFVLSHRRVGKPEPKHLHPGREAVARYLDRVAHRVRVAHDNDEEESEARRVVHLHADPTWLAETRAELHDDLILEETVDYGLHSHIPAPVSGRALETAAPATTDHEIRVTVTTDGRPLPKAQVVLQYVDENGAAATLPPAITDETGEAKLSFHSQLQILALGAYPAHTCWPIVTKSPGAEVSLDCPRLPESGPLGWWHRAMGIEDFDPEAGKGLRIGLIGTGIGPNPLLDHVKLLDGKRDISQHGTAVAGVLGARPLKAGQFAGIAPAADFFSIRAFEMEDGRLKPPSQGTLALAIDKLAGDGDGQYAVDLINMSLGGGPSAALADAVDAAYEAGTLVVASAGNTGGPVQYPAACEQALGVSALGKIGTVPENSTTSFFVPDRTAQADHFGEHDFYLAKFSNFGEMINCAAPGSGVVCPVPSDADSDAPYTAMDGTSIASPLACGLAALVLAKRYGAESKPPRPQRAPAALALIAAHMNSLGLRREYEGGGLPSESAAG